MERDVPANSLGVRSRLTLPLFPAFINELGGVGVTFIIFEGPTL